MTLRIYREIKKEAEKTNGCINREFFTINGHHIDGDPEWDFVIKHASHIGIGVCKAKTDSTEGMFTQSELNDAVSKARGECNVQTVSTEGMFTQSELDDAVSEAKKNAKEECSAQTGDTEVIFTQSKLDDAVTAALQGMFTEEQKNEAVTAALQGMFTEETCAARVEEALSQATPEVNEVSLKTVKRDLCDAIGLKIFSEDYNQEGIYKLSPQLQSVFDKRVSECNGEEANAIYVCVYENLPGLKTDIVGCVLGEENCVC